MHGGLCTAVGTDSFTCNCSGTGFEGDRCELGIIIIEDLPLLKVGNSYTFEVEAQPKDELILEFTSVFLIPSRFVKITLTKAKPTASVTLRPTKEGLHQMKLKLGGRDEDFFTSKAPSSVLGVVAPAGSSDYYKERGVDEGILDPGCCTSNLKFICPNKKEVNFESTCQWSTLKGSTTGSQITNGIVFASTPELELPLSISGTQFYITDEDKVVLLPRKPGIVGFCLPCQKDISCGTYGEPDECYCITPSPSDRVSFLQTEAVATTFLKNTLALYPTWIEFQPNPTDRSHTSNSGGTILSDASDLHIIEDCPGLLMDYASKGLYDVLQYSGSLNITLGDEMVSYHPAGGDVVCFGINLCNGQRSAVHVSLPPDADALIQQLPIARDFSSRHWKIKLTGFSITSVDTLKPGSVYNLATKGSLQTAMDINGVLTSLQITGQAGIKVPSVEDVRRLNNKRLLILPVLLHYLILIPAFFKRS